MEVEVEYESPFVIAEGDSTNVTLAFDASLWLAGPNGPPSTRAPTSRGRRPDHGKREALAEGLRRRRLRREGRLTRTSPNPASGTAGARKRRPFPFRNQLHPAEGDDRVGSTEAEAVGQHRVDLHLARHVGHHVEPALGVLLLDVQRRGDDAPVQGHAGA